MSKDKETLNEYLYKTIKECSEEIHKEEINSQGWIYLISKKTFAEDILIKFC